jgi:hypothetical protein
MKLIKGNQYNYVSIAGNIPVIFIAEEKDFIEHHCNYCNKKIRHIYFFEDDRKSTYAFGSECIKKIIR